MKAFRLNGLKLSLDEREEDLAPVAARALGVSTGDIASLQVLKKALDSRRNRPPHFVYAVKIVMPDQVMPSQALPEGMQISPFRDEPAVEPSVPVSGGKKAVAVIGCGPAGLFAAYTLAIKGIPVIMLERGRPVEQRTKDVALFWEKGELDPQSNVLFGEGGAGTFSDGKLTSRSKNPYAGWVKKTLVELGAPSSILTDAKPHIGTDRLRRVLVHLRQKLMEYGCSIRFESQVTDIAVRQGAIIALVVNGREEIRTGRVILAIGQSADDTYHKLSERGVKMEPKPFAMGARVEHPQALINAMQYGRWSGHPKLPPAEYFVTAAVSHQDRSVYTFCMCPGGQIIGCSAFPGTVITNGMSHQARSGEFANSAVVVNVRTDDFSSWGWPLGGLAFREHWERKAFVAGGGNYCAPAQKLTDFVRGKASGKIGKASFLPGVKSVDLSEVLPLFVTDALRAGLGQIDRKMPGFLSNDAHLIGVETRTSSPVRICRTADGQSETVRGLYPCGEGAGYAGGIISSALDGIKAALHIVSDFNVQNE